MNPIERDLARLLLHLRENTRLRNNSVSVESSEDDLTEYNSEDELEHFRDIISEKIDTEYWTTETENGKVDTPMLDSLVLDYLTKAGLNDSVAKFLEESGLSHADRLENKIFILRDEIAGLMTRDLVDQAVTRLNEVDLYILTAKKTLWLEMLSYKLDSNLESLEKFVKQDLVQVLASCQTETEREELVTFFDNIVSSIFVEGKLPFNLDSTLKEIGMCILIHFNIDSQVNIEELLSLTYATQDRMKSRYYIRKLTSRKFTDSGTIILD